MTGGGRLIILKLPECPNRESANQKIKLEPKDRRSHWAVEKVPKKHLRLSRYSSNHLQRPGNAPSVNARTPSAPLWACHEGAEGVICTTRLSEFLNSSNIPDYSHLKLKTSKRVGRRHHSCRSWPVLRKRNSLFGPTQALRLYNLLISTPGQGRH